MPSLPKEPHGSPPYPPPPPLPSHLSASCPGGSGAALLLGQGVGRNRCRAAHAGLRSCRCVEAEDGGRRSEVGEPEAQAELSCCSALSCLSVCPCVCARVLDRPQRPSCGCVACTVLLSLAILLAVVVTAALLFLNHSPVPGTAPPPVVSTGPAGANSALVTVERADSSRLSITIDPRCPDLADGFARLEGAQASVLRALTERPAQARRAGAPGQELLDTLADQLPRLLARASELQAECTGLRKVHSALGQGLSTLQSEQGHLIQLLSESQGHMAHLVNSIGDFLDALQRDRGLGRPRVKADLQRAPARGVRPRGCASSPPPRDCLDVLLSGQQEDGVYSIFPTHYPAGFQVYCDMRTDGGGWTVFQRREDGSVNFFRGWEAYREGFGKLTGEHWLGLKRIHALSTQATYELHVALEDFDNGTAYAHYGSFGVGLFSVDPEEDGYPLTVADYSGTAGDSLLKHSGMRFTTKDRDSDHSENNCAAFYRGAWWYRNCHTSNLNGQYLRGAHASYADGVEWASWTGWQYSLKFSEMKIRPAREGR
ncbi:PREDICTED: fibrinogen C domain-containing protein 1 [Dipodomys ordii]|uniref:Fibrinogen C domain-containing protein 1 n=1 Tax=Dipodomys ordii TaxID=10020 RepID=A0A1S3FLJ3_DIPOR|nr:PREDICTED: fibrinogen C domain-containing protein 1 [Dipodomys ordii]